MIIIIIIVIIIMTPSAIVDNTLTLFNSF